jgi:integrase
MMARRAKGEGTLRKRNDGRWEGWFTLGKDVDGKTIRKSVTAKNKSECIAKLEQAKKEYASQQNIFLTHTYLKSSDPTLKEWYDIWMEVFCKAVVKDYTANGYRQRFELYILPMLGECRLREISTVTCQQMLMKLYTDGRDRQRTKKGNGLSISSVNGIRRALNICLQKAVDEGLIVSNPCSKVKLPQGDKHEMKTLKKEEITTFLREAKNSGWYEFYYLELTTGLRLGEICALTWKDFDEKNKTISVNKTVTRIHGENIVSPPKTKSSIRTISLCDECVKLLMELKLKQKPKSKYIFPSPITGDMREPASVTRRLHKIQDRAGLPRIRFHDLRHSFATLSLEQGVDIKTVSHMLGHTDAGFTMNTYMHVTNDMQQQAADTIGGLLEDKTKDLDGDNVIKLDTNAG